MVNVVGEGGGCRDGEDGGGGGGGGGCECVEDGC
ncbi:hypothetical protein Tco_0278281, partial [Tanacetum coccineum]